MDAISEPWRGLFVPALPCTKPRRLDGEVSEAQKGRVSKHRQSGNGETPEGSITPLSLSPLMSNHEIDDIGAKAYILKAYR